jgi:hypothetical protein
VAVDEKRVRGCVAFGVPESRGERTLGEPAKSPFASVGREASTNTVSKVATLCGPGASRRALSLSAPGGAAAFHAHAKASATVITAGRPKETSKIQRSAFISCS